MSTPQRISNLFGAKAPSITVSAHGTLNAVFGAGDTLYFAGLHQGVAGFSAPRKIAQAGHLALGMRRGPRLALSGKTLVVSAIYGQQGGGRDGELLVWRSLDEGGTWQGPATVNDVPGAAREGLHAMAAAPDGMLACAWLDLREKGTSVFASVSTDGGKSWRPNTRVYSSPSGTVCECCHVSAAFTPVGELLVMFRNVLSGNRDMYLCRSRDKGKSFMAAQKLGVGSWLLNACPMDGGMITVDSRNAIVSAWRREEIIYTCIPGKPEQRIEVGQQPWVASGKGGTWCTWLVGRPGKLRLQDPTGAIRTLAEGANDPMVAAIETGDVAVAWTGRDGLWAWRTQ